MPENTIQSVFSILSEIKGLCLVDDVYNGAFSWYLTLMFLFTLLLFPIAFFYYVLPRRKELRPRFLISLFAFAAAGVICAFRGFFMFRSVYDGSVFLYFYLENAFTCVLFPLLVYLFFLILSRDSWREKISSFALFMLPFYAVYLPAEIFANAVPLPFFFLFIKPLLYLLMVIAVAGESKTLFNVISGRGKELCISLLIIIAELFTPPLIETLWHYAFPLPLWAVPAALYAVLCVFRTKLVFKLRAELMQ